MAVTDVTLGVVGSGGDGVVTAGEILAGGAARVGIHCLMISAFGPQIRGGETSCTVRLRADGPVHAQGDAVDVLAVLSWDDFYRFRSEIEVRPGGVVISDADDPVKEGTSRWRRATGSPSSACRSPASRRSRRAPRSRGTW